MRLFGRSRPYEWGSVFKGTRVPVQALIDTIEGNSTLDDFLGGFPSVSPWQAIRFIELAKDNLLACVSS